MRRRGFVLVDIETHQEYLCKGKALPVGSISPNGKLKKVHMKPATWGPNPDYKPERRKKKAENQTKRTSHQEKDKAQPREKEKDSRMTDKEQKLAEKKQQRETKDAERRAKREAKIAEQRAKRTAREQKSREAEMRRDAIKRERYKDTQAKRDNARPAVQAIADKLKAKGQQRPKPLDVPTTPMPSTTIDKEATTKRLLSLQSQRQLVIQGERQPVIEIVTEKGITYASDGHALLAIPTGWDDGTIGDGLYLDGERMRGVIPKDSGDHYTFNAKDLQKLLSAANKGRKFTGAGKSQLVVAKVDGKMVVQGATQHEGRSFFTPHLEGTAHKNSKSEKLNLVANFDAKLLYGLISELKPTDSIRMQLPSNHLSPMRLDLADGTTMVLMPVRDGHPLNDEAGAFANSDGMDDLPSPSKVEEKPKVQASQPNPKPSEPTVKKVENQAKETKEEPKKEKERPMSTRPVAEKTSTRAPEFKSFVDSHTTDDYPYGRERTEAKWEIETHPGRGQRVGMTTKNPKTGRWNKTKYTTYAPKMKIALSEDNKVFYISGNPYAFNGGLIGIDSTAKTDQDMGSVHGGPENREDDPRWAQLHEALGYKPFPEPKSAPVEKSLDAQPKHKFVIVER